MDQPCVQTITNVNPGCGIDTTATWKVVAEYDDAGVNLFDFGPVDLGTARAILIALAGRTNVRKATITAI